MAHPAQQLAAAGFSLDLLPGDKIKAEPVNLLTAEWARFIRSNKAELIEALMAVEAANDGPPPLPAPPPLPGAADRFAWPRGPAMNRAEIERMAARLLLFEAQGMPLGEAEAEADRLMHLERTRSSPAPLSAVPPPATPPAPAKQHPYPTSELDRAYMRHHFACPVCQAVGRGIGTRCAVGLTLHLFADGGTLPMH